MKNNRDNTGTNRDNQDNKENEDNNGIMGTKTDTEIPEKRKCVEGFLSAFLLFFCWVFLGKIFF